MIEKTKNEVTVKLKNGLTINLGQYESAKIEAGVEIQGSKKDLSKLWKQADEEVTNQLIKQKAQLEEEFDERKTILGLDKGPKFNK